MHRDYRNVRQHQCTLLRLRNIVSVSIFPVKNSHRIVFSFMEIEKSRYKHVLKFEYTSFLRKSMVSENLPTVSTFNENSNHRYSLWKVLMIFFLFLWCNASLRNVLAKFYVHFETVKRKTYSHINCSAWYVWFVIRIRRYFYIRENFLTHIFIKTVNWNKSVQLGTGDQYRFKRGRWCIVINITVEKK